MNQDMEDEEVIETVDFAEFEALFQVQHFKKNAQELKREESKQVNPSELIMHAEVHSSLGLSTRTTSLILHSPCLLQP